MPLRTCAHPSRPNTMSHGSEHWCPAWSRGSIAITWTYCAVINRITIRLGDRNLRTSSHHVLRKIRSVRCHPSILLGCHPIYAGQAVETPLLCSIYTIACAINLRFEQTIYNFCWDNFQKRNAQCARFVMKNSHQECNTCMCRFETR